MTRSTGYRSLAVAFVVGAVVIAAVIAGTVWFLNNYISKSDYQVVADHYNSLGDLNKTLDTVSKTMTEVPVDSEVVKALGTADVYQGKLREMGELRAVKKDPGLGRDYQSFRDQQLQYLAAVRGAMSLMRAAPSCKEAADSAKKDACLSTLAAVNQAGAPLMTEFASGYSEAIRANDYLAVVEIMSKYQKSFKTLQTTTEQSSNAFRDAINRKLS